MPRFSIHANTSCHPRRVGQATEVSPRSIQILSLCLPLPQTKALALRAEKKHPLLRIVRSSVPARPRPCRHSSACRRTRSRGGARARIVVGPPVANPASLADTAFANPPRITRQIFPALDRVIEHPWVAIVATTQLRRAMRRVLHVRNWEERTHCGRLSNASTVASVRETDSREGGRVLPISFYVLRFLRNSARRPPVTRPLPFPQNKKGVFFMFYLPPFPFSSVRALPLPSRRRPWRPTPRRPPPSPRWCMR